jgi:hypothetical protein
MNPALIFQTTVLIFFGLVGLIVLLVNLSNIIDLLEKKDNEKD